MSESVDAFEAIVEEENLAEALNAFDRCDRCQVQAHTIVFMPSGNTLTLCGHHTKEHHDALVDQGGVIHARAVPA